MSRQNLTVEYVSIGVLKMSEYNPRKHTQDQIAKLKESIKRFGMVDPIICNNTVGREHTIIGGHFRAKVAKELGFQTLPVVYLNIPDIHKEKELSIRLNKNTGEWDFELLKSFDFDLLTDIGFNSEEFKIWDNPVEPKAEDFDEKKELAEIIIPETQLGDIVILGNHRLICGDSNDPEVLQKLCGDQKISMVYSDPIYNINLDYNKGLGGKQNYGADVEDNRTESEYVEFLKKNIISTLSVAQPDCHFFYWNTEQHIWIIQTLYKSLGIKNKRVCLWIKNGFNVTPQVAFSKCFEPCIYGTIGSPYLSTTEQGLSEILNPEIGNGNQSLDDINNIWTEKRLSGEKYKHATSKPPELHHRAIKRCSKVNDIILDSFGGSGSTLIACEQLKRRAYLVELAPIFCDLIIKRFEKLTGIKAKVLTSHEKTKMLE